MIVMSRREDLLDQVTDHVLAEGLIGLTLRPVASAIGTSDRMLLYHFKSRDELVTAVVARTIQRAVSAVDRLPTEKSVRSGVNTLWQALLKPPLHQCIDIYCQAAATGLIGTEPYLSVVRESNDLWSDALERYLVRCGADPEKVDRIVTLVDSSLFGFHLDLTTDNPDELIRGVDDLAVAAQALADA